MFQYPAPGSYKTISAINNSHKSAKHRVLEASLGNPGPGTVFVNTGTMLVKYK